MSFTQRITSAFFSALPGSFFFYQVVFVIPPSEYYWKTDVVVGSVLLGSSLFFGFVLPALFSRIRLRTLWASIMASGILAMALALLVMTALNATSLCVGRDNGDGNNDFGMCMGYVVLAGIVFGSVYMLFLTISAVVGHWVMKGFSRL